MKRNAGALLNLRNGLRNLQIIYAMDCAKLYISLPLNRSSSDSMLNEWRMSERVIIPASFLSLVTVFNYSGRTANR